MQPEIIEIEEKKLAGINTTMSLMNNKTAELWKRFMPLRNDIPNTVNKDLFSLQVYPENYFKNFSPATEFEKWALIEVASFDDLPKSLKPFTIPSGSYAAFHYKGSSANANELFRYIFDEWLPSSTYELDNRPHFELLGEKYNNNSLDSEEMVYIPIKIKP